MFFPDTHENYWYSLYMRIISIMITRHLNDSEQLYRSKKALQLTSVISK